MVNKAIAISTIVFIILIGYNLYKKQSKPIQPQKASDYRTLINGSKVQISAPTVLDTIAEIKVADIRIQKEYAIRNQKEI